MREGYALEWPRYSRGRYGAAEHGRRGLWVGSFIAPWLYRACVRLGERAHDCSAHDETIYKLRNRIERCLFFSQLTYHARGGRWWREVPEGAGHDDHAGNRPILPTIRSRNLGSPGWRVYPFRRSEKPESKRSGSSYFNDARGLRPCESGLRGSPLAFMSEMVLRGSLLS